MAKKFSCFLSVFLIGVLVITGCGIISNPFISNPKVDKVIKSGEFFDDTELQIFPLFNCGSLVQNSITVSRSRTLERSIHLDLNGKIGESQIEISLKDKDIKDMDVAIGGEFGWEKGTIFTDSSGLLLNAAPNSYPIYTIAWRQQWEKGSVEISTKDGTGQIPYRFLSQAHPEIKDITNIDCTPSGFAIATSLAKSDAANRLTSSPTSVVAIPTATSQVVLPTGTSPAPALTPQLLKKITVPGNDNSGITYNAPQSGLYIFQYSDGVYSTGCGCPSWSTLVLGFRGNDVKWANSNDLNYDLALFTVGSGFYTNREQATKVTKDTKVVAKLTMGEKITLVVADGKPDYIDNSGTVILDIYFIPSSP